MKKWMLLPFALILMALPLLLPRHLEFREGFTSPIPMEAIMRTMARTKQQQDWWPGSKDTDSSFVYNNRTFITGTVLANRFEAKARDQQIASEIQVSFVPGLNQTTQFTVDVRHRLSANPYKRLLQYLGVRGMKTDFKALNAHFRDYFSTTRSVYGFDIALDKVRHSPHLSRSEITDSLPSTEMVYALIRSIQSYVATVGAKSVDSPILHIVQEGKQYKTMVAVPTDRVLQASGPFMLKQMVLGNILIAKVEGGAHRVKQCELAMDFYVSDYRKTSPAIRFQRLITNRMEVPDTTKWVTTVNYPVFK